MIQYRSPSWAAREVSKGKGGRTKGAYCMQSFSFPHSHNMLDAVHALHANAVGPWSCRSSTAAARNITRLTGLCDGRAEMCLLLGKRNLRFLSG